VNTVEIVMLAKCYAGGTATTVGQRVRVGAVEALDLVQMGRAELAHDADMPALVAARRLDVQQTLGRAARGSAQPGASPWSPPR
jgi:hypothetical protein